MIKKSLTGNSLFLRNLLLTSVLGGIVGGLNYLFNIGVARFTNMEIFAIYSAALGIIYLVQIPALSIQALVTRYVAQNRGFNLNHYKWRALLTFFILGLIFSTVFYICRGYVSQVSSLPENIMIYLAITFLFAFISPISKGLLFGVEKIVTVNLLLLGETVLRFVFGIVAIQLGGDIPLLILSCAIPSAISTLIAIPLINLKGKDLLEKVKIDLKDFFLATVSFLLLTVPYTVDLILVNPSFRAEYSGVSLLGKLVYFAAITIASVMFARVSSLKRRAELSKSLLIALLLSVIIGLGTTAVLVLFKDRIVSLTIGDSYLSVAPYLWIFGLCMTGYALVYMIANYFISQKYYVYIFVLLISTILQLYLFKVRNNTLDMVIMNQVIVYLVLTIGTFITLSFNLYRKD